MTKGTANARPKQATRTKPVGTRVKGTPNDAGRRTNLASRRADSAGERLQRAIALGSGPYSKASARPRPAQKPAHEIRDWRQSEVSVYILGMLLLAAVIWIITHNWHHLMTLGLGDALTLVFLLGGGTK